MTALFHDLVFWLEHFKYALMFAGSFFEGPVVMLAGGLLYRLGQVAFLPAYLALVGGDFTADMVWYLVGYYGARPLVLKFGRFINLTPHNLGVIEERFQHHHDKILWASKLTMGLGFAVATLTVAGMLRVPIKKYIFINLVGGLVWVFFLMLIGFFFGNIYTAITPTFRIIFLVVAVGVVLWILKMVKDYLAKLEM